ncbi:ArnT family glycosyltransferase [Tabrizicola sp.]|uniref:ArnT family glycosyltransferase n=1 Tax=Tabrizicola sp. TaxID=2005166 RepID=UPI003F2D6C75
MQSSIAIPRSPGTDPGRTSARSADVIAFGGILALVLFRAVLALFDRTELSTDEAQYWFWGQHLDFGAYSKPPLIGWIMRLATDLMGQTVWAVRLSAVPFHGATAAVIYVFARRIAPHPVAMLAAILYLTTPAVALGSALMTTDTPMLLAAALAMLAQVRLAQANSMGQRDARWAIVLGLALGFGLLAKHAMLFWLVGAAAAAVLSPAWRVRRADAGLAVAVFAAVIAPHLVWLLQNGSATFVHLQHITDGETLSLLRPLRFLAEQFLVMGPIVFFAMLLAAWRREQTGWTTGLVALALTPLVIVLAQGVNGPVLANWAVLYLAPGSVLAALWLAGHPLLGQLSIALGLLVSLALPLAKVFGTELPGPNDRPLLARYLGHAETAGWALDAAGAAGARTLVAEDRDLLADLSWFGAKTDLAIRAVPPRGMPRHHWEMTAPFQPAADAAPVVLLLRAERPPPCPETPEIARFVAGPGFAANETFVLFRLDDPSCLARKVAPR